MKKIGLTLIICLMIGLCLLAIFKPLFDIVIAYGVGNKKIIDVNYHFNKALVYLNNGEKIEIDIDKWNDYEGEQIQLIDKNGKVYLVSSYNTILIGE